MSDTTKSRKRKEEERECMVKTKQRNVIMGVEVLDCSFCLRPLEPQIFQCSCGHLICKNCNSAYGEKVCKACSGPFSQRAYGLERVLQNAVFPCMYDCGMTASGWYDNKQHEKDCLNGPSNCLDDDCDFQAPKAALLDHMSTVHKWPSTSFKYGVQFDLPAVLGYRILRCEDDDVHIFLLNVADPLDNGQHTVRIEPVGLCDTEYDFGCSVSVAWQHRGRYQHRSGSCDDILLKDEDDWLCIFRDRSDLVLKTIMTKKANDHLD